MTRITRQLEYFKLQLKYLESISHNKLTLKTLDALMRVSICGLEGYAMDWATIQHLEKHARSKDTYARLIGFFVKNQDCILIIQNISFP